MAGWIPFHPVKEWAFDAKHKMEPILCDLKAIMSSNSYRIFSSGSLSESLQFFTDFSVKDLISTYDEWRGEQIFDPVKLFCKVSFEISSNSLRMEPLIYAYLSKLITYHRTPNIMRFVFAAECPNFFRDYEREDHGFYRENGEGKFNKSFIANYIFKNPLKVARDIFSKQRKLIKSHYGQRFDSMIEKLNQNLFNQFRIKYNYLDIDDTYYYIVGKEKFRSFEDFASWKNDRGMLDAYISHFYALYSKLYPGAINYKALRNEYHTLIREKLQKLERSILERNGIKYTAFENRGFKIGSRIYVSFHQYVERNKLDKLLQEYNEGAEHVTKLVNSIFYRKVYPFLDRTSATLLFVERGQGSDLFGFRHTHPDDLTRKEFLEILFQLFYTIHEMNLHGVRHNDLHAGNVWINFRSKTGEPPKKITYFIDSERYVVISNKYTVKIYDFDQSVFTHREVLEEVSSKDFYNEILDWSCTGHGACSNVDPKYDIYTVISTLYSATLEGSNLAFRNGRGGGEVPNEMPFSLEVDDLITECFHMIAKDSKYKNPMTSSPEDVLESIEVPFRFESRYCHKDPDTGECIAAPPPPDSEIASYEEIMSSKGIFSRIIRNVHSQPINGYPVDNYEALGDFYVSASTGLDAISFYNSLV